MREDAGYEYVQFCLVIDNLPAEGLECDVHVLVDVQEYTAKMNDFRANQTYFIFEAGSENGSLSCQNISFFIIGDHTVEYDEHFLVSINSSYPPLEFGSPDTVEVVILDDDGEYLTLNCFLLSQIMSNKIFSLNTDTSF